MAATSWSSSKTTARARPEPAIGKRRPRRAGGRRSPGFEVRAALLNLGAARVAAAGDAPLTFTAAEAVEVACVMSSAIVVPLHFEGWKHFTESRSDVEWAFAAARLSRRLMWATAGEAVPVAAAQPHLWPTQAGCSLH